MLWASSQILKIAGCACPGDAGNVFPPPRVSDPAMHHGTWVMHVPWCMPGSLRPRDSPGVPSCQSQQRHRGFVCHVICWIRVLSQHRQCSVDHCSVRGRDPDGENQNTVPCCYSVANCIPQHHNRHHIAIPWDWCSTKTPHNEVWKINKYIDVVCIHRLSGSSVVPIMACFCTVHKRLREPVIICWLQWQVCENITLLTRKCIWKCRL